MVSTRGTKSITVSET